MINKLLELYLCQLLVVSLDQSSKFGNNPGAILIFSKEIHYPAANLAIFTLIG